MSEVEMKSVSYYTLKLDTKEAIQVKKTILHLKKMGTLSNLEIRNYLIMTASPELKQKIKNADMDNLYDAFNDLVIEMQKDAKCLDEACAANENYQEVKAALIANKEVSEDLKVLLQEDNPILQKQIEEALAMARGNKKEAQDVPTNNAEGMDM